jgi:cellulose synthase/poly-beta-1,6-N-acetylglucosamine synthase-like glycosyltransferase
VAVQGFPISKAYLGGRLEGRNNEKERGNWVSGAIDFRLANRNELEFFAKQRLDIPVQKTGNLFMVRASVLRSTKFCSDLCEDWDLTLDLYMGNNYASIQETADNHHQCPNKNNEKITSMKPVIAFNPRLVCYCKATTRLESYFKQRMRVREGHIRAFRRRIVSILQCKQLSLNEKYEFAIMGFQYAKLIVVPIIIILDTSSMMVMISLPANMSTATLSSLFIIAVPLSISIQLASLFLILASIILGIKVCSRVRRYGTEDVANLLALNILPIPAIFTGSLRGLLNNSGTFYRTERNILHAIQDSEA